MADTVGIKWKSGRRPVKQLGRCAVGAGRWTTPERLPDDLKRSWSCRLTAFLRPAPPMFRLRAGQLALESEAFADYARRHPTDPVVARYKTVVKEVRGLGGSVPGDHALWSLLDEEAQAQRKLLAETLQRVRDAWAELQRGHT